VALLLALAVLGLPVAEAAARQAPLDISGQTNFIMPMADVPTGFVSFSDTSFRLDPRVFHSRDAALSWYPDQLSVAVPSDGRAATAVQVLVNLDGAPMDFNGQKVGEIVLVWRDGAEQTVDLIAGVNVRGWLLADSAVPLRDAGSREVFRGADLYGRSAVIDSLTVVADPSERSEGLARVIVRDTSFDTANSLDPGLVVRAITVVASD
jgi:hypothetical protein